MKKIIIATQNRSKLKEIREILGGGFKICSLYDLNQEFHLKEDGDTFFENAAKKALAVSDICKKEYVVGEDSGLAVEYLNGGPGIYSKRYSGKNSSSEKNNSKLLKSLSGVPASRRQAEFICALVLAKGGKQLARFQGSLPGIVSESAKGMQGFGYDPVFFLPQYQKTAGQLPPGEKNKISHRTKAFLKLKSFFNCGCRL